MCANRKLSAAIAAMLTIPAILTVQASGSASANTGTMNCRAAKVLTPPAHPTHCDSVARDEGGKFADGIVYYPNGEADKGKTFGTVALMPGLRMSKETMEWLGPELAAQGFVTLILNSTGKDDSPELRGKQLVAALNHLASANDDVSGRIDKNKLAVMGWSYGGGAAIHAAAANPSLKAAIAFVPGARLDAVKVTVPTLVVTDDHDMVDTTALGSSLQPSRITYDLLAAPHKGFFLLKGVGHLAFADDPVKALESFLDTTDVGPLPHIAAFLGMDPLHGFDNPGKKIKAQEAIALLTAGWLKRHVDGTKEPFAKLLCPAADISDDLGSFTAACPVAD